MRLEQLCRALCSGLDMRPVPIGFAIKTPFRTADGDALSIYLRREKGNPSQLRFEDDGATVAGLEEDGVSLNSETRAEAFADLLVNYDAHYDDESAVIYTDYFLEDRAPANFAKFIALMLRVQDLRMLSQERVREVFRDDVRSLLEKHFADRVEIVEDENPSEILRDYVADFVLRSPDGETLAIYAASTEIKALEALLLWQELSRRSIPGIRSMAIFEGAKPQRIRNRTMSRLMNSDVMLGAMDGDEWELARKVAQTLAVPLESRPN